MRIIIIHSVSAEKLLTDFADEGYQMALVFFKDKTLFIALYPPEINYSIQQWLTFGHVSDDKLNTLLGLFSPIGDAAGTGIFDVYYPKGSYEANGRVPNDFNGGHHTLASLYAALGDTAKVIHCFEKIRESGQNDYFIGSLFNNYTNIMAIFYQFGYR